jgi:hypothetical protein
MITLVSRARSELDKQDKNEVLFSLLLPECATLGRVSASFFLLHLSYSLCAASLSASTVFPFAAVRHKELSLKALWR